MNSNPNHNNLESILQEIRGHLETKKRQIADEILHYPPPIPACDAQFNYLLEERARISQELGHLNALAQESLTHLNPVRLVEEFIALSRDVDDETEQRIRSHLAETQKT